MSHETVDIIKERILAAGKKIEQEAKDLDYVINKIQTGVDFLPIEVAETIRQWKEGQAYQRSTFDDLKRKFRYKAYSVEDGWELLHMYHEWILQQRQTMRTFIDQLGTKPNELEDLIPAIRRAEENEWDKESEMDMEVILSLREIEDMFHITVKMEQRLPELETACRKRADQIIAPDWEPKGSL